MQPSPALRVLIAIQHDADRAGIRAALLERGFDVVGECRTARDAVAAARLRRPDICLLDLDLRGEGLGAVTAITSIRNADTRVVAIAETATVDDALAAFEAGGVGFLLKNVTAERLVAALRDVARGHFAVSPELLTAFVESLRLGRHGGESGRLTTRERQVLALLRIGLTTKEVAQRIGVSATTVRRHVSSAVQKLGADSRRAAIDERSEQ